MPDRSLVEEIIRERVAQVEAEVRRIYPLAIVESDIDDEGRGIITASIDSFVVTKEFVETEKSAFAACRFSEYFEIMANKSRLVLIVPQPLALKIRLRMLDFNQMWLFYYLVYSYDFNGRIRLVDAKSMKNMIIQTTTPSCPEVF